MSDINSQEIIFVYNADSDFFSALSDFVSKLFSPDTYSCNLCAITHGSVSIKKEWKEFIDGLGMPVEFLHRDEFLKLHPMGDIKFPAAFAKSGTSITLLITPEEINSCKSAEDLMAILTKKLEK